MLPDYRTVDESGSSGTANVDADGRIARHVYRSTFHRGKAVSQRFGLEILRPEDRPPPAPRDYLTA
jgi:hypothetical protein